MALDEMRPLLLKCWTVLNYINTRSLIRHTRNIFYIASALIALKQFVLKKNPVTANPLINETMNYFQNKYTLCIEKKKKDSNEL